ncbi:MAG: hypothetical protein ACRBC3_12860 [Burkholderiaceae bacterium]
MSAPFKLFASSFPCSLTTSPITGQTGLLRATLACGLLLVGLSGCGGGAGAGSPGDTANDDPNNPPIGSGGQDPLPITTGFQTQTVNAANNAEAFIAQVNEQGQQGYRYRSGQLFGTTIKSVFITDLSKSSRFTHKALDPSSNPSALVSQANEQGALGFRFRGNLSFTTGTASVVALYTSDSEQTATYAYKALTPQDTVSARQTQLKSQGALGYRFIADFDFGSNGSRSLYARDTSSDITFDYIVQSAATTTSSFLTVANLQGGNGYRFRSNIALVNGSEIASIFMSSSAGGTVSYSFLDPATTTELDYLEQVNAQGAESKLLQTELVFGGTTKALYADLSNCNCQALRIADPFTD